MVQSLINLKTYNRGLSVLTEWNVFSPSVRAALIILIVSVEFIALHWKALWVSVQLLSS